VADYRFLTTWLLEAPREAVFQAIWDWRSWPSWWRGVESVMELEPGNRDGVGTLARHVWRSRLPYRLEFELRTTRVERPRIIEGAARGELSGTGRWRLFEDDGVTAVVYEWVVRTTRVERPRIIEGAARGELSGTGRWRLFEDDGVTAVVYEWVVRTTSPWMNRLAPLARPVFGWNHDVVMRWGGEGLARRLGARLLAHD
jgi:hypothetical protein